ncbi:hypothetical protein HMPREF0369_01509 [Anaerostipes hadrus ATCC 29173 = JCM 17467]|nr:hypothetical protein HMPREF0369_01509 [Anaerostipes hadrus ATCC 29173 = JCM 17467]
MTDKETWTLARICKTSYYKYKRELQQELLLEKGPRQKNDRPKPVNLSDHFLIH